MLRENYVGKQQRIGQRLTRAMAKAHMDRRELAELTGYCVRRRSRAGSAGKRRSTRLCTISTVERPSIVKP
jgi:hypothetical protein